MAENYNENEVAVHQLLNEVTGGAWLATPRYYELQAAVLARMCGPGEVICKLPPGYQIGADGQIEKFARTNNGGNDDAAA